MMKTNNCRRQSACGLLFSREKDCRQYGYERRKLMIITGLYNSEFGNYNNLKRKIIFISNYLKYNPKI